MYNRENGGDGNLFPNLLGGDVQIDPYYNPATDFTDVVSVSQIPRGYSPLQEIRKGVFSNYPAMTPKYTHTNDDRALETMARLIVPLADPKARANFVNSFGKRGSQSRELAQSLASIGSAIDVGGNRYGLGYIDFLLTTAAEAYQEKVQVIDVLSDNYVAYFFGARPPVFTYSGVLLNSKQDDWRSAFTIIYNDIIRGTELARRRAVVTLSYDNMAVTGALVSMNQNFSSEGPLYQLAASFTFQLLVQRIDVERILLSKATEVSTFPSYVKPGEFASKQFDVPPKTIRTTGVPETQTVERVKETTPEDLPFGTLENIGPENDVYGNSRTDADAELDALFDSINGQSIPDEEILNVLEEQSIPDF